jgi:hypothetical protein
MQSPAQRSRAGSFTEEYDKTVIEPGATSAVRAALRPDPADGAAMLQAVRRAGYRVR